MEPGSSVGHRVGRGFIALYSLAFISTSLVFIAPLLVTLALKVNTLVGTEQAPTSLSLVAGVGALLSILVVAEAPTIPVVLLGWCVAQVSSNALLAAMVAVLPDQVPAVQRGLVSGVLGVCLPIASVSGTFVVTFFTGNQAAMFMAPCAIGGFFILLFAGTLNDRRLARADRPTWSMQQFAGTFYVNPRRSPDFACAFVSRFMFVLAYAFLTTYQAYYLLNSISSAESAVPQQIFLGTLTQSVVLVAASLIGGRLSDRTGRRKIFVLAASITYGLALFVIAVASSFDGFLVGMAISGLGFGVYVAVDLALVVDVLPDGNSAAKDLGVFNIAGALPFSIAPAIAPVILSLRHPAREGCPMRTRSGAGGRTLESIPRPQSPRRPRVRVAIGALVGLLVAGATGYALNGVVTTRVGPPTPTAVVTTTAPTIAPTGDALTALATLAVKGRAPMTGYERARFGPAWSDVDRNGCDTRNDILRRDLTSTTLDPGTHGCVVRTGTLHDPYTGRVIAFVRGQTTSGDIQVDHVVALGDAWQKGAQQLTDRERLAFANDPLGLLAVDGPTNVGKGDGDAATWLPPAAAYRCAYAARQVAVKVRYHLWVTPAEHDVLVRILGTCPGQPLPG